MSTCGHVSMWPCSNLTKYHYNRARPTLLRKNWPISFPRYCTVSPSSYHQLGGIMGFSTVMIQPYGSIMVMIQPWLNHDHDHDHDTQAHSCMSDVGSGQKLNLQGGWTYIHAFHSSNKSFGTFFTLKILNLLPELNLHPWLSWWWSCSSSCIHYFEIVKSWSSSIIMSWYNPWPRAHKKYTALN